MTEKGKLTIVKMEDNQIRIRAFSGWPQVVISILVSQEDFDKAMAGSIVDCDYVVTGMSTSFRDDE